MKKSELVTLVAEKTGFSKKDTEKTIDTVFTAIADIMAAGDKLQISGFGIRLRPRSAQHAQDTIRVPASRSILQRPLCRCSSRGRVLKDKVDGNK